MAYPSAWHRDNSSGFVPPSAGTAPQKAPRLAHPHPVKICSLTPTWHAGQKPPCACLGVCVLEGAVSLPVCASVSVLWELTLVVLSVRASV